MTKSSKLIFSRRRFMAAAAALPLLAAPQALAARRVLRGTVSYRERVALPPSAIVEVKLVDVSLADAPARTIAGTRIRARAGSPIAFVLRYNSADIAPGKTYALQARITDGDRLLFINTMQYTVFDGGPDNTGIRVEHVRQQEPGPEGRGSPAGTWLAEDIRGGGVIDFAQTTLQIEPDGRVSGRVSGHGGCNRYGGRARIRGSSISFGPMVSTKMACAPALMDQEQKFHAALASATHFRLDHRQSKLFLLETGGRTILRFSQM